MPASINEFDRRPSHGTKASSLETKQDDTGDIEKQAERSQQQQRAADSSGPSSQGHSKVEEGETIAGEHGEPAGFQDGHEVERMVTIEAEEAKQIDFPDGGREAWLVVAGAWSCSFVSWGYVNAFGVLAEYYLRTILADKTSSEVAWISSLQYCLIFAVGLFTVSRRARRE